MSRQAPLTPGEPVERVNDVANLGLVAQVTCVIDDPKLRVRPGTSQQIRTNVGRGRA